MADTIRERIIAAFTARAASLSNLPVQRAQRSIGDTQQRFISIWDGEDQAAAPLYGQEKINFTIAIECIWQHGEANPSIAANALMGEIITTMIGTGVDRTFGGLVDRIVRTSSSPSYPAEGNSYTTVTVIFMLSYITVAGDPYTAPTL